MNKLIYKILTLLSIAVVIITAITMSVAAHPGKTDSKGGHHDNSAGEYHYHHGYPAHQHSNGVCPYDFDDKTSHENKQSSNSLSWVFTSTKSLTVDIVLLIISMPFALLLKTGKLRVAGRFVMIISLYIGIICCIYIFPTVKETVKNCYYITLIITSIDFLLGNFLQYFTKSDFFFKLFLYLIAGIVICFPFALVALG